METNSLIEEKNLFETNGNREEMIKLRLEAADLKLRLLKIKERQMKLLNQEKKKKMKESTPPPLKERKEIRKEGLGLVITTTTTIRAIFRVQNEEM